MSNIRLLTPLLILFFTFAVVPPASANFVALGQDQAGDAADPHPGRDIVKVGLSYNRRTGHLRGGVALRGAPTSAAAANLTLFAGRRTGTGCNGYPAIGFGTQTDLTGADWVLLGAQGPRARGSAVKLYDAAAEEYEATARPLAGKRPDCVIAALNDPQDPDTIYDVAGPYNLRGLPELEVRLGKLPSKMRPGRTRKVRLTIRNRGDAPTGRVRLAPKRARGLTVRLPRRVVGLRAGTRRTMMMRVTLNRRARTFTNLRITAKAPSGLRASDRGRLFLSKPSGKSRKGSSSGGSGSKLCYRYTWMPPYSTLVPC